MNDIVTKHVLSYPDGYKPNYIIPKEYTDYRYAIGKLNLGKTPLVAICMNPSAASDELCDRTVNRIINVSKQLKMDGWIIFNTYPQRATDAKNIQDDNGCVPLRRGREKLISMLESIGVKIFYYGTLTKAGNPRHPLQRMEKCNFTSDNKHYL